MISEILPEEKRRLYELEQQLFLLEKGNTSIRISDVYLGVEDMGRRLEGLDQLALQENKTRRDDFRRKIQHLKSTHMHLKSGLDACAKSKRYVHVSMSNGQDIDDQRQKLFGQDGRGNFFIDVNQNYDIEKAESGSINRSSKMVGEYIKQSQETLSELLSQKERMKGIQRKVLDIMNYLGISNNIMRTVERREITDKWIMFGGMAVVIVLLVLILFYWRK
jgi:golgi SNAP receptor complex member 2